MLNPIPLRLTPDLRSWLDQRRSMAGLTISAQIRSDLLRLMASDLHHGQRHAS